MRERERERERGEVCRMNRGVFQSSTVQQIMGGSPSWWNLNNLRPASQQTSPFLPSPSSSVFPQYPQASNSLPLSTRQDNQDLPESWSQLLLGGLVGEEDKCSFTPSQPKRMDNWEGQATYPSASSDIVDHVKQEISESGHGCGHVYDEIQGARSSWSHILSASSPRSCVTSFSSNMLDFSNNNGGRQPQPNLLSARNSALTGSTFKKARVQETISSAHSTFKVRKEKLGDRITALHQLVSPFGKTDTASVLLEAIGYIRFLHGQIEALSSPYLGGGSGNLRHSAQGERGCLFPEVPGQDGDDEPKKDLRSRGLCLVPVSCNLHVGSDNGADYWAPALGGGF